ncbi:MAG: vWA domain-containing protein [Chitinophagaceae bacterium]
MKWPALFLVSMTLIAVVGFSKPGTNQPPKKSDAKIQVAILLDVSNSMDGLIEQAKAQLWNMVITLGKAQCTDQTIPKVEVALYEYGRTNNEQSKGYVKQLSSFTNDLDSVSKLLFGVNTNGGSEYCGQVIYSSLDELSWDAAPDNYKVIFIAGNEDFLQGTLHYTKGCDKAKEKGVIVNTIYCGNYEQGIREHWHLVGECGNGSYTNINQDAKEQDIPTPYDSTLVLLNNKLNNTYIGYGAMGSANIARQQTVDAMNGYSSNVNAKRIEAKAQKSVYNNSSWDLVDATRADSSYFAKVDRKTLPDSLKNKSPKELEQFVKQKTTERDAIQQEINTVAGNRNQYIATEKAKAATTNTPTLESAVEKTIREQAQRYHMQIRE